MSGHSVQDFALAPVVGGDSQRAVLAAMQIMNDFAAEMKLTSQRDTHVQSQYAKDMGAANMGLAGMVAKMAFSSPTEIQVGGAGGNSGVRQL